jgi:hypothetical protein
MDSTLGKAAFAAVATPSVFLDRDLTIRGANPAYLEVVGRTMDDLDGHHLFSVFPENPGNADDGGRAAVEGCLRHVLAGKGPNHLPLLRYDIPLAGEPGTFTERYWSVIGTPIFDVEGELAGVLVQAQDVTAFRRQLLRMLGELNPSWARGTGGDGAEQVALPAAAAASVVAGAHRQQELRQENEQLQHALTARATIDQAIGIVLAEHPGTPEEAFQRLVAVSQETNVKLRDVARALVARAAEPERPLAP